MQAASPQHPCAAISLCLLGPRRIHHVPGPGCYAAPRGRVGRAGLAPGPSSSASLARCWASSSSPAPLTCIRPRRRGLRVAWRHPYTASPRPPTALWTLSPGETSDLPSGAPRTPAKWATHPGPTGEPTLNTIDGATSRSTWKAVRGDAGRTKTWRSPRHRGVVDPLAAGRCSHFLSWPWTRSALDQRGVYGGHTHAWPCVDIVKAHGLVSHALCPSLCLPASLDCPPGTHRLSPWAGGRESWAGMPGRLGTPAGDGA